MTLLSQFHFKGKQEQTATDPNPAIAVTAGAGSGKTLSLVGRYLHLLEQGYPIRSILAITFTEKAAREMRSRIRNALSHISTDIHPSEIDFARIGTIHSLCAELLRSHPAEAGLDPAFEVLEEGLISALQAEAVESVLVWMASDEQTAVLFSMFKEDVLRQILNSLISRRLDMSLYLDNTDKQGEKQEETHGNPYAEIFASALASYLIVYLDSPSWTSALADLSAHHSSSLEDKLELARQSVLIHWDKTRQSCAAQNWDDVLASLTELRKAISTQGQKNNWDNIETVRESMKTLRDIYDEHLKFLAEKSRFSLDERVAEYLPAIHRVFEQTIQEYQILKDDRQALDFDDLESLAARLLTDNLEACAQIQSELRAVLVDEFQDTNERQRRIVYALTGFNSQSSIVKRQLKIENCSPIDLFVVGDSKQSIYRFRQADVTIFRQVQADIQAVGGLTLDLDITFRAHKSLLDSLNSMLASILGETDDSARPYLIPFTPLRAYRQNPERKTIRPPFIEFHLGLGESAEEGRQTAAQALASRLRQLQETEGFAWGDMALLFRSSTTFPVYESALEAADIPFITVAGHGFYDRPEIRDLLNALAAIADPTDDLALVGLLRSPAFAMPDAEIYRLRFPNPSSSRPAKLLDSIYSSTLHNSSFIPHPSIIHAYDVITDLHSLSGRIPAAAILKRFLDLTHYRAILASDPNGARMIRNVDKFLADAHRSRLVSLTDFLAYVRTLRDVSFREGEAPADASSAGAVQLMTIHKAKGLEFPLTILADAAHQSHPRTDKIQLAETLLLDLRSDDLHPTAWQLAARREAALDDAEDRRLLYVAATRAKEKLIINGHIKQKKDGLSLLGWLSKFPFLENLTPGISLLKDGIYVAVYPYSQAAVPFTPQPAPASQTRYPHVSDLLGPLVPPPFAADDKTRTRESDPPQRVWRIVSKTERPRAPSWLVGRLVHEAIRYWHFPDETFNAFLYPFALESGLTDEAEIHAAIHESRRMLERLHAHPLFKELDSADCHHEIHYNLPDEHGIIDLLYRTDSGWCIIDFKTDEVNSEDEARETIRRAGYDHQVARYARAIENQLKAKAKTRLVFLNVTDSIAIFDE